MGSSVMLNVVEYAGEQIAYKDSTYELVSKVAFLIGVPQRIFENEHEAPQLDVYERLSKDKNARIIRNLCIIRTSIERNFRKINDIMRMEYRGLLSMPEIIPPVCMQQLNEDGITFIKKSSTKLCQHIIEINRLISDRINNCKNLFPIWINWKYIKELFVMPNGLTEAGTKEAAGIYYANLDKNVAAVNSAIGGTSSGEDKKMVASFQQASKAVKDAVKALQEAGKSAKDWAAKA